MGIGFATPIDTARRIVPELIANGFIKRGWIEIDPVSLQPDPKDLVFEANPCDLAALGAAVNMIRAQRNRSL